MIGTDEKMVLLVSRNHCVERVFILGYATLEGWELSRLESASASAGMSFSLMPADEPFTVSDIIHDLGLTFPSPNGDKSPLDDNVRTDKDAQT